MTTGTRVGTGRSFFGNAVIDAFAAVKIAETVPSKDASLSREASGALAMTALADILVTPSSSFISSEKALARTA